MPSPERKRKKMDEPSATQKMTTTNPSLPYDLLLSCIARVSRLYYPTLSLVSKSFRSLLASPELYNTRSLLGRTERCLYVCIQPIFTVEGPSWYTLCGKPNQTLTNHNHTSQNQEKPSGYVLVKVPFLDSPRANIMGLVTVGSDIYNIGSRSRFSYYGEPSSSVWILDCRSHTWHKAPSMKAELNSVSATVVDRKIYVTGSSNERYLKSSCEVLDTRTQTWEPVPRTEARSSFVSSRRACVDGKFHLSTEEGVVCYSSDERRWYPAEASVVLSRIWDSCCGIENVLYGFEGEAVVWYDTKASVWRKVEGLVGLLPKSLLAVRLADYGGKMLVFWDEESPSSGQMIFWCAEIALERRGDCEIWGEVKWCDQMLTSSMECYHYHLELLVATV